MCSSLLPGKTNSLQQSAVTRFMPCEMLTRNDTPLTNITLTARVTRWCHSRIALGILTWFVVTDYGSLLTICPLTPARSGPKIRLAFCMAVGVEGPFQIMPERTFLETLGLLGDLAWLEPLMRCKPLWPHALCILPYCPALFEWTRAQLCSLALE
jgi:hypothetical protein